MIKRRIIALLCTSSILVFSSCGKGTEQKQFPVSTVQPKLEESRPTEDVVAIENTDAIKSTDIEKKKKSIQDEIAKVEKKSLKYENADWSRMSQSRMNQVSAKWYQLWDDELNSLWHRLSDELDAKTRMRLLKEQRAWIKRKEGNV